MKSKEIKAKPRGQMGHVWLIFHNINSPIFSLVFNWQSYWHCSKGFFERWTYLQRLYVKILLLNKHRNTITYLSTWCIRLNACLVWWIDRSDNLTVAVRHQLRGLQQSNSWWRRICQPRLAQWRPLWLWLDMS